MPLKKVVITTMNAVQCTASFRLNCDAHGFSCICLNIKEMPCRACQSIHLDRASTSTEDYVASDSREDASNSLRSFKIFQQLGECFFSFTKDTEIDIRDCLHEFISIQRESCSPSNNRRIGRCFPDGLNRSLVLINSRKVYSRSGVLDVSNRKSDNVRVNRRHSAL